MSERDNDVKGAIQLLQAIPAMRDLQEMFEGEPQAQHAAECERMLLADAAEQLRSLVLIPK